MTWQNPLCVSLAASLFLIGGGIGLIVLSVWVACVRAAWRDRR